MQPTIHMAIWSLLFFVALFALLFYKNILKIATGFFCLNLSLVALWVWIGARAVESGEGFPLSSLMIALLVACIASASQILVLRACRELGWEYGTYNIEKIRGKFGC